MSFKFSLLICASLLLASAVVLHRPVAASEHDEEKPPTPQLDKVEPHDVNVDEDELPVSTNPNTDDLPDGVGHEHEHEHEHKLDLEYMAEPRNKLDIFRLIQSGFKEHYEIQYDKINKFLVERLGDNVDPDANLAEAKKWLEQEREEQREAWLYTKQATIAALEQFLDLDKVRDPDTRCSHAAYTILWKNNKATRGRAQKPPSELTRPGHSLRHIEAVYYQISLAHSFQCFHIYPRLIGELLQKMDQKQLRLIETYMDNLLGERDCIKSDIRTLLTPKAAEKAYELILKNSYEDSDNKFLSKTVDGISGKLVVKDEGVKLLVERYIIEPCTTYVNLLGPNIFIPVKFALRVFEPVDRYNIEQTPLLHSRIHYRLCKLVIGNEKDEFIKNLTKHIKSKA